MNAAHTYSHSDVLNALCPILLILWIVLLTLGIVGLVVRRPFLLDPLGSIVAGVILLAVWLVFC